MEHSKPLSGIEKLMQAIDIGSPAVAEGYYIDPATDEQLPNRVDVITCSRLSDTSLIQGNNAVVIYPKFGNR